MILSLKRLVITGSHNKCLKALSTSVTHWDSSFYFCSKLILFFSFRLLLLVSIIFYICSVIHLSHQKMTIAASAAEVVGFCRHMELTRKTRGRRICFCANEGWRTDVTVLEKNHAALICRPFSQIVNGFIRRCFPPLFWAVSSVHPTSGLADTENGHGAETSRLSACYSSGLQCYKLQLQTFQI